MLFFAKNHFPTQNLLPDAEMREDIVESVLRGDAVAEDGVEGGDDGTEIFSDKVAGELGFEATDHEPDVL